MKKQEPMKVEKAGNRPQSAMRHLIEHLRPGKGTQHELRKRRRNRPGMGRHDGFINRPLGAARAAGRKDYLQRRRRRQQMAAASRRRNRN